MTRIAVDGMQVERHKMDSPRMDGRKYAKGACVNDVALLQTFGHLPWENPIGRMDG
jgi:hypothetical protein